MKPSRPGAGPVPRLRRSWVRPLLIAAAAYVLLVAIQGRTDKQAGVALAALAKPGDIVMLSSEVCRYCDQARSWLSEHRVPFSECFIEKDAACADRYRAQQSPGTPTLMVRGERQVGFDPGRITKMLGG
ncbi:MAG: glutaredoxin family protein [Rhizobacter sp.]